MSIQPVSKSSSSSMPKETISRKRERGLSDEVTQNISRQRTEETARVQQARTNALQQDNKDNRVQIIQPIPRLHPDLVGKPRPKVRPLATVRTASGSYITITYLELLKMHAKPALRNYATIGYVDVLNNVSNDLRKKNNAQLESAPAVLEYRKKLERVGVTNSPLRNPRTNSPCRGTFARVMKCTNGKVAKIQSPPTNKGRRILKRYVQVAKIEDSIHRRVSGCRHVLELLSSFRAEAPGIAKFASILPDAGQSLYHRYAGTGTSLETVAGLGKQLLEALVELGNKGVIHADLKPENILLDDNGLIRVADYGISQRLNQLTTADLVCSRFYRPPEEVCRILPRTPAMDIWSTGCILYELLTGHPLFPVDDIREDPDQADANMLVAFWQRLRMQKAPLYWIQKDQVRFHQINGKFKPSTLPKLRSMRSCLEKSPKMTGQGERAIDFYQVLKKMIDPIPENRISAEEALEHPFFKNGTDMGVRVKVEGNVRSGQNLWMRIIHPDKSEKTISFNLALAHSCYHMKESDTPFTIEFYHPEKSKAHSSSKSVLPIEKILGQVKLALKDNSTINIDSAKYAARIASPKIERETPNFLDQSQARLRINNRGGMLSRRVSFDTKKTKTINPKAEKKD